MRVLIILSIILTNVCSLHKSSFDRALNRFPNRKQSLLKHKLVVSSRDKTGLSFFRLNVIEHLASCSDNEVIKDLLGASSEYCLRENIDIVANFKGFSEQIFNIGFLVIAYFMIKRANNRGISEINDLLRDNDLEDEDNYGNNGGSIRKKRLPKCPQCNGTGKYMWKGETLDVCELCDGDGFIDFSTSTTSIRQLPNNIRNNNWIDDEQQ